MTGEIIAHFPLTKVTVLFDCYYLCPNVTRACEAKQYHYVGVAKKNRNFFPDGRDRDKRKLAAYGKNLLGRLGRTTACRGKKYRLAERVGRLSKLGRVKLVFSRRVRDKSWIAMATNATRWGALRVLNYYLDRWPIEVLLKESEQYLGLGDYQVLRYRGIERYLCLRRRVVGRAVRLLFRPAVRAGPQVTVPARATRRPIAGGQLLAEQLGQGLHGDHRRVVPAPSDGRATY